MKQHIIIILLLSLTSCIDINTKDERSKVTTIDSILCKDTNKIDTSKRSNLENYYINYITYNKNKAYSKLIPLYSKTDTLSKVIDSISIRALFHSLKPEKSESDNWITIQNDTLKAFIHIPDVASYSFHSLSNKQIKYFIIARSLYKYNFEENKFIDSFDVNEMLSEASKEIQQINSSQWKNVDLLLEFKTFGECCGCSDDQYYIIHANGKFELLFHTTQYADDGGVEEGYVSGNNSYVTLPFNPQVDTIHYNYSEYGPVIDKNANYKRNKNGEIICEVLKEENKYYNWDGTQLIEIPLKTKRNSSSK